MRRLLSRVTEAHRHRRPLFLRAAVSLWLMASAVVALQAASAWRVPQGAVRVMCPMTIGGSFDAKSSAMSGSLTANGAHVDGTLVVDLKTLDTGIALRNDHMRDNYLEVGKGAGYDTATLTGIDLKGLNGDRKSTRLNSSHVSESRMPSSA